VAMSQLTWPFSVSPQAVRPSGNSRKRRPHGHHARWSVGSEGAPQPPPPVMLLSLTGPVGMALLQYSAVWEGL
jgi:hypothetical protein